MSKLSPRELATKVAKESHGVSVKIGQCNGDPVLHLFRRGSNTDARTIPATETAWNLHPYNTTQPYGRIEEAA